jgi:deoxyribonuclease-4
MKKSKDRKKLRLGVHTSIAGGVSKSIERAAALNCNTLQIFSHNPRQWQVSPVPAEEAERFAELRNKYDISPAYIHTSYLINLVSLTKTTLDRSIGLLASELEIADMLGAEYVVLHTGSVQGVDEKRARARAAESILKAIGSDRFRASLLLENTAGERGDITSSIKTLAEIIDRCRNGNIAGVCIDTCHAFAAGYDLTLNEGIEKLITEVKENIGLDGLKLIHLNDSKKPLGSGVDRHEHIGQGYIGIKGFKKILSDKRLSGVPLILETPKKAEDDDKRNLKKVSDMLSKL